MTIITLVLLIIISGTSLGLSPMKIRFNSITGKQYAIYDARKTFLKAKKACEIIDSRLAIVSDLYDNRFLAKQISEANSSNTEFWIGKHMNSTMKSFKTIDGGDLAFTNWAPGNQVYVSKTCYGVTIKTKDKVPGAQWLTRKCSETYRFICQFNEAKLSEKHRKKQINKVQKDSHDYNVSIDKIMNCLMFGGTFMIFSVLIYYYLNKGQFAACSS